MQAKKDIPAPKAYEPRTSHAPPHVLRRGSLALGAGTISLYVSGHSCGPSCTIRTIIFHSADKQNKLPGCMRGHTSSVALITFCKADLRTTGLSIPEYRSNFILTPRKRLRP